MRKLKLFFACLLMAVLSIGQMWGADVSVSFSSWTTSINTYSATEWTDNGCTFTYANNNQKGWAYVRCGGKSTSATSTIEYNTKITVPIDSVVLSTPSRIANGSSSSITITGIEVAAYSDAGFSTLVSSKDLGTLAYTSSNCPTSIKIAPTTAWAKDLYYKISISWTATGSKNCGLNVSSIKFWEHPATPSYDITAASNNNSYGTVALSGSVITATANSGYRIDEDNPYTISPDGSATVVRGTGTNINKFTVTPSANTTVTINFKAIPTHNIIFNNGGVKTIANAVVAEGASYDITETIENSLIASCTYKKFEGWTRSSSIANANVKPTLVTSVEMEDEDINLYAVYSITTGGGGTPTAYSAGDEGDFVIASYNTSDSKWYAIPTSPTLSSGKIAGVAITVNATAQSVNYVTSANASGYTWTIANATNGQTLSDGTKTNNKTNYLCHSNGGGSGTNLAYGDVTYTWNIASETNGLTFQAMNGSTTNTRGMLMNGTNFGGYSLSNEDATGYYRIQVLPIVSSGTTTYSLDAGCAAPTCANLDAPTLNGEVVKTQTSATINWNTVAGASSYSVNVTKHEGGASAFSGNVGNVLTKELTGLDANTQYDFSIMAVGDGDVKCADGNELLESNFTTPDYPTVTVTYSENGNTDNQVSKKTHTPFNLPTSAAACGKTFVGWTTKADFEDGDESLPSYYASGAEFTITNDADITIYAVYADVTYGPATWDEIADVPTAGTYAICTESYFLKASINSGNRFDNGTATPVIEAGQLTTAPDADCQWEISKNASEKFLIKNGSNYAGGTDAKNKGALITDATDTHAQWEITYDAGFTVKNVGRAADSSDPSNAYLRQNGTNGWATYAAGTGTAPRFFKKNASISGASNYSITCVDAPTATPASNPLEVSAAGASSTLGVTYENVNLAGVSVALCSNNQGATFTGDWLTATIAGEDKHIEYTVQANTSYNDARTAYIRLTAPETSGAASPAVVYIEVTQAKKPAVFANLAELVAAEIPSGEEVTVTFDEVITGFYTNSQSKKKGIYLTTKAANDKVIELYYNQGDEVVPSTWVAGGKASATAKVYTWTYYTGGTQWELVPNGTDRTWTGDDFVTYTAPKAVSSVVVSGAPAKDTYVDGEKFNPAGLTVTVNYNDATSEVNPTGVTFACTPVRVAKSDDPVSVSVVATFNEIDSDPFEVTGLTVGDIQPMSIEDFIAAGNADMRCYLEGVVSDIETGSKLKYGNFNLTDASGTIYVYGCLTSEGEAEQFGTLGVANGDKIKVIAEDYEYYNSKHEAKNVVFVSKISPVEITIADKTLEEGEEWTIEATTDPAGAVANISYSIKEGSDGCITLDNVNKKITANSVGTATIIASIPDGEGYLANSIEFEVEVVEAGSVANVVILVEYEGAWYAMKHDLSGVEVDYQPAIGKIYGMTDPVAQAEIVWSRSKTGTTYTFTYGDNYLKGGNKTDLSVGSGASGTYQWEKGAEETYYHCLTGRTFIYNGTAFKNYAVTNAGNAGYSSMPKVELSDDIFTSHTIYTRNVSGNYGTICLPKAGVMTNGVLYEISYYDADQKKIFFDEVEGGVMVAGAPYIFKPNENVTELKVAYTDVAVVDNAGHKNGLYGHYDLNNPTEGAEAARLFLTNGDYFLRNNEYWLVDQEDRVYVDNYRAYIKLNKIGNDVPPQAYGRRRVAMNVNGEQVATGFENLNASEKPVKLMIDGNIYILRGEKLYDTTGRLVK